MNTIRLLVRIALCAAFSLSVLPEAHAQFTYTFFPNDATIASAIDTDFNFVGFAGGSYDDDFNRNFFPPSSPTVNVIDGASIPNGLDINNSSIVNITGGSLGFTVANDHSRVNVSGGSTSFLLAVDNATVDMTQGSVDDLELQGYRGTVRGGTVITKLVANSQSSMFGDVLGSCIVDVTGGNIAGELDAYNSGILNLYGGQLGGDLYAAHGGTINIFGVGLTTSLLDAHVNNRYSLYSLSGTLSDGAPLNNKNLYILNDGVTYGHSSFNLVPTAVPEPGNVALVLTGAITTTALSLRRRRVSRGLTKTQ